MIIGCQADYVMVVKGNQPSLLEDIQLIFQQKEAFADRFSVSETIDLGHGRLENRCLWTNSELVDYTDWPGLQQVFQLQRRFTFKKSGHQFEETVYGVTSLKEASPSRLLEYIRQHWHIENHIGCVTLLLMKIVLKFAAVAFHKLWQDCAILSLV